MHGVREGSRYVRLGGCQNTFSARLSIFSSHAAQTPYQDFSMRGSYFSAKTCCFRPPPPLQQFGLWCENEPGRRLTPRPGGSRGLSSLDEQMPLEGKDLFVLPNLYAVHKQAAGTLRNVWQREP